MTDHRFIDSEIESVDFYEDEVYLTLTNVSPSVTLNTLDIIYLASKFDLNINIEDKENE